MKMTKKTLVALVIAGIGLLAVGGASLAFAAPAVLQQAQNGGWWPWGGRGGPGGLVGTVQSVDASQLVISTAASKTYTVTVTAQTQISLASNNTAVKVTDIKVGDTVQVKGRPNTSGAIEAQSIVVGPLPAAVGGQVTAVSGAEITVQAGQGTQVIVTDSNTKFYAAGNTSATLADVKTGDIIMAQVQKQSDGSLLASQVTINTPGALGPGHDKGGMMGAGGNRVGGQVTAVDGNKITVQAPYTQTAQSFVTDTNTKFYAAGKTAATLADVKTGTYVMAQVQKQSDGSLLATQVTIGTQDGFGRGFGMNGIHVSGQVTAVDGTKITVQVGQTAQTTQVIVTDSNTKFYASGNTSATLADVKTGTYVMAQVQQQSDGSLLATQVMIGTQNGFGRGFGKGPGARPAPAASSTPQA